MYFIREWCEKRGVTYTELAARAGVQRSTVSEAANGHTVMHRTTTRAIARALRIKPETLLRRPK